jgi:hypothetical protein
LGCAWRVSSRIFQIVLFPQCNNFYQLEYKDTKGCCLGCFIVPASLDPDSWPNAIRKLGKKKKGKIRGETVGIGVACGISATTPAPPWLQGMFLSLLSPPLPASILFSCCSQSRRLGSVVCVRTFDILSTAHHKI